MRSHLFCSCSILCLLVFIPETGRANSLDDHLSPRGEISVKGGSERSTLTTEFWAPLAQQSGKVVYTDIRLMGDSDDNREGNLGFGYRQVTDWSNSVLGGHIWIDRRRTEHNNTFHQITIGAESLGKVIDLRANGYIALNGDKTASTPATGPAGPFLAGSSVFYNTNGSITETPQHGVDAEAGYRLSIFEKELDSLRVYGGGYSFFREGTSGVTGIRFRTEAQVNAALNLGARYQYDEARGSQGFLEATIRFPFSAKKLYREKGLYSRLDESPERDIDIVTSAKATSGLHQLLNPTSGEAQRILYVDNSNASGVADGTKEHPFTTLSQAQASLKANDILYITAGNGTTTGMNQGITISQNNVQVVGSGSALTIQGITFLNAGTAPVISNNLTSTDDFTGNGVTVTGDNAVITGLTVNGATNAGIFVGAQNGNVINNASVTNNATNNNGVRGIYIDAESNGHLGNVTVSNNTATNNGGDGIRVHAFGGTIDNITVSNNTVTFGTGASGNGMDFETENGSITTANILNNTATDNAQAGFFIRVRNNATVSTLNLDGNTTSNNHAAGVTASARTLGTITQFNVSNATANGNGSGGLTLFTSETAGQINQITVNNIHVLNNTGNGLSVQSNTGATLNSATVSGVVSTGNTTNGVALATGGGMLGQATLSDINSTGNGQSGLNILSSAGGTLSQATVTNATLTGNTQYGFSMQATGAGSTLNNISASNVTASSNSFSGIFINATTSGAVNSVNLSGVTANNNVQRGLYVLLSSTATTLNNVSVDNSNFVGNTLNGVHIQKANAAGTVLVDLGGGSLNSAGNNRIFGNTGTDINLDRVTVSAKNNWWNNGVSAPTRVTTANGGSGVFLPVLTADPRP